MSEGKPNKKSGGKARPATDAEEAPKRSPKKAASPTAGAERSPKKGGEAKKPESPKKASPTKKPAAKPATEAPVKKGAKPAAIVETVVKKADKKPAKPAAAAAPAVPAVQEVSVPETLLKRRKRLEHLRAARAADKSKYQKVKKANRKIAFKRAEQYVREYRKMDKDLVDQKRSAKSEGKVFVPAQNKVAFVIRTRGINKMSPKVRKISELLRLRQIFNGVFVKMNKATVNMIRIIEPYVTYGYPNLKSVRELVYKRGHLKIDKQRIAITNNELIAKHLGHKGIICIEDIIHELYTCGPNFSKVSNILWPFKLNAPRHGMNKKRIHFNEGGDYGNREEEINEFIRRTN